MSGSTQDLLPTGLVVSHFAPNVLPPDTTPSSWGMCRDPAAFHVLSPARFYIGLQCSLQVPSLSRPFSWSLLWRGGCGCPSLWKMRRDLKRRWNLLPALPGISRWSITVLSRLSAAPLWAKTYLCDIPGYGALLLLWSPCMTNQSRGACEPYLGC